MYDKQFVYFFALLYSLHDNKIYTSYNHATYLDANPTLSPKSLGNTTIFGII